jgi:hypothetical protein
VLADKEGAFATFSSLSLGSRILSRAIHGYYYDFLGRVVRSRNGCRTSATTPKRS